MGQRQHSQSSSLGGALAVALGIGAALAASTAVAQADTPDAGQPSISGTSASAEAAGARSVVERSRSAGPRRSPAKTAAADASGRTRSFTAPDLRTTIPAALANATADDAVLPTLPAVVSAATPKPAVTAYDATVAPPSAALASVPGIFGTAPPAKPAQLPLAMTPMLSWLKAWSVRCTDAGQPVRMRTT